MERRLQIHTKLESRSDQENDRQMLESTVRGNSQKEQSPLNASHRQKTLIYIVCCFAEVKLAKLACKI